MHSFSFLLDHGHVSHIIVSAKLAKTEFHFVIKSGGVNVAA
jgi:hypothetical protein